MGFKPGSQAYADRIKKALKKKPIVESAATKVTRARAMKLRLARNMDML